MIVDGNRLTADEGKSLTNGETYSKLVYLGKHDSINNWHEINDEDIPDESTIKAKAEAYDILVGGAT